MSFEDIGKAFINHYYTAFDTNRPTLQSLYKDVSMLSFEGEQFMGVQGIMTKLTTLQFTTVQHQPVTIDCQPGLDGTCIVIMVTGNLAVDGNTQTPIKFAQSFQLKDAGGGQWYIHNDIFRLNYC